MDIPVKVIERLTLYHFILDDLKDDEDFISSTKIANILKIDSSQVRKDLKYIDNQGKCRVGYNVKQLKTNIEKNLGFKQKKNAFIIGAGNLGSALAKYASFKDYGLNILAMFDIDTKKIGTCVNDIKIFDIEEIESLTKKLSVDFVILTVPKQVAQKTAKYITDKGIKYIWNFTPCVLYLSDNIKVWNENLISSFLQFKNNDEVKENKNDKRN